MSKTMDQIMTDTWLDVFTTKCSTWQNNATVSSAKKLLHPKIEEIMSADEGLRAKSEIQKWDGYKVTPLHYLEKIAKELRVADIHLKDESSRFGLGSFKALGGAYAVFRV